MNERGKTTRERGAAAAAALLLTAAVWAAPFAFFSDALAAAAADFRIEIIPGPQCYDGIDNDGDGKTDYPEDPGCSSQGDDDESGSFCGDGTCGSGENCAVCPADCGQCPSGEGGGGGAITIPSASAAFSGRAYPLSKVVILKDGQRAASVLAGPDAKFNVSLSGLSAGAYVFSVYGEDKSGKRSPLFTFPAEISKGASVGISGIFIAPTIDVDKKEVKRGDNIAIFGQAAPESDIIISVNSEKSAFVRTRSGEDGAYLYNFDTSALENGSHYAKSKAALGGEITSFGKIVGFAVGEKNIAKRPEKALKGDLNGDGRVNLVDFSIAAYWHGRKMGAAAALKEAERLNGDGKIDLADFSIMAFYWTG